MIHLKNITPTDIQFAYVLSEKLLINLYSTEELLIKHKPQFNNEYLVSVYFVMECDEVLAQFALYYNPFIQLEQKKVLCIGNVECIDNAEVAKYLFDAASDYAFKNGFQKLIGPINGSTWDDYRIPINFDFPMFFTEDIYKQYYPRLFIEAGFEVLAEYVSTQIPDLNTIAQANNPQRADYFIQNGIHVRNISLENYENEINTIFNFSMKAFSSNYLFSPISELHFREKYLPLKKILNPEFCLLAFNKNEELVALFFAIPDVFDLSHKTLIVKTIAQLPAKQYAGLSKFVLQKVTERAISKGFTKMINAFMHVSNISFNISNKLLAKPIRTYQIFYKNLN